jgi:phage shock protein PspC (stress-responsive transcriptional regulator)
MKKTFTINIGGIIFHIDDDAYTKLNAYIASIKKHFTNLEGCDEIIADIESRIAEILQSKLTKTKEVIVLSDINEVIERMGEPSDFVEDPIEEETQKSYNQASYKRLYRDSEEKLIGGVAGGIAAYFNVDPIWVRLIFILSIFTTLGPFIYLILWVALPEAMTAAEKLEMRGQKVTISNIEKSVKEEFENLKDRFSDLSDQTKKSYKKNSPKAKNIFENILDAFILIFKVFIKGLLYLVGFICLILGISFVFAFVAGIFGFGGLFINDHGLHVFPLAELMNLFFSASGNAGLFKVGLFLLLVVPFLMLIYHGIRLIIGFERISGLGTTAFALWIMGLIFTAVFAFKMYHNFKYEALDTEKIAIEQPDSNFIFIKSDESNDFVKHNFKNIIEFDDVEIVTTDDFYFINQARLEITESHTNKFELLRHASARGRTGRLAKNKAEKITYHFEQNGNTFDFDYFFGVPKDMPWSDPDLKLELRVPIGTKIKLDRDIQHLLRGRRASYYRYWSDDIYIMTENGLEKFDSEDIGKNSYRRKSSSEFSKLSQLMFNKR